MHGDMKKSLDVLNTQIAKLEKEKNILTPN